MVSVKAKRRRRLAVFAVLTRVEVQPEGRPATAATPDLVRSDASSSRCSPSVSVLARSAWNSGIVVNRFNVRSVYAK